MSSPLLASVDRHTRLAGHNRVALLLFTLGSSQRYGINVFKVREILRMPALRRLPGQGRVQCGVFDYRGRTVTVIALGLALDLPAEEQRASHLIVCEFSGSVQAFAVDGVDHIVHVDGTAMERPDSTPGGHSRLSAVARVEGELVGIVDVEQVLAEASLVPAPPEITVQVPPQLRTARILVADDSALARRNVIEVLAQVGLKATLAGDGEEALSVLRAAAERGQPYEVLISDIEMPRLDGYALTRALRADPAYSGLRILLHSSLSGVFNEQLVRDVGADRFLAKFQPQALAEAVLSMLPHAD